MSYGLNSVGFVTPTLSELREQMNADLRASFGDSIDLGDKSAFGQIVGIIAEQIHSVWEQAEAINSSQDADKASGASLEGLSALTGTFRPASAYSVAPVTLTGLALTVVAAGSSISTTSTSKKFLTTENAVFAAAPAWVIATGYVIGDTVTNASKIYRCTVAGTSAVAPTATTTEVVDGTVTWTYVGAGVAYEDVTARAELTGPVTAYARDLATIVTPTGGWQSVINLLDAAPGRDVAPDAELRLLREQELSEGGNTTIDALRAEILGDPDVLSVNIFVNNSDYTDAEGVPPHSVEALVRIPVGPAFDQRMFDILIDGVACGVRTHGISSGYAVDDQGTSHLMKFSRPIEQNVYATLNVVVDAAFFPGDGIALVKQAVVDWGDQQANGKNVVSSAVSAQAFLVPGMLEVTSCFIGLAPAPVTSTTIPISLRELAVYDTSRVVVNVTIGVP